MKRERGRWTKPLKDFLRLARADDLLSRAGALMMRSSPKATIWTAGIALSGRLASYLGLPGFTRWQALTAPVVVGGVLLALGAVMRYVPRVLSGRLTTVAEANDLNLMEDYRKSQAREHLNILWDRVFWYESQIRYSRDERQKERDRIVKVKQYIDRQIRGWDSEVLGRLGVKAGRDIDDVVMAVLSERPVSNNMEKSREGFILSALYALRHPLPQSSEAHDIGFRLNLYEDLCDGAYFDCSDVKLFEQYTGNALLLDVKREVGFGRLDGLRELPRRASSTLWFFLVTRKIAVGAGRAVQVLNERYHTDVFNSQVLLWPGEEDGEWLNSFSGARDEIRALRRSIVKAALGNDPSGASAVLDRVFLGCFEFATELRARYDPEYCDGSLDYVSEETGNNVENNLVRDLESRGYRRTDIDRAREYAVRIRREQSAFMEYLTSGRHGTLMEDRAALRAVKIAFHTNKNEMKRMFQRGGSGASRLQVDREIDRAAAEAAGHAERLVGLRLHHQLTILQIAGYKDLAMKLAYSL